MSLKQTLLVFSVSAGLAVSVAASAQPMRQWDQSGFRGILAAAGLSTSQEQQVRQLMQTARSQNSAQYAQLRALHQQIERTLFASGSVTAAQLTPMVQQEAALREQLEASRIQTALSIRALMTPAQLAQAASAQAQLATLHQQERAITQPAAQPSGN